MIFTMIWINRDIEEFRSDSNVITNVNDRNYDASNPLGFLSWQLNETWPNGKRGLVKHISHVDNFVCFPFLSCL